MMQKQENIGMMQKYFRWVQYGLIAYNAELPQKAPIPALYGEPLCWGRNHNLVKPLSSTPNVRANTNAWAPSSSTSSEHPMNKVTVMQVKTEVSGIFFS